MKNPKAGFGLPLSEVQCFFEIGSAFWLLSAIKPFCRGVSLVGRLCTNMQAGAGEGKPVKIHVQARGTSKHLSDWEEEGRCLDPAKANLSAEAQQAGVLGVSLSFLKKLASEKDIPSDSVGINVRQNNVKTLLN